MGHSSGDAGVRTPETLAVGRPSLAAVDIHSAVGGAGDVRHAGASLFAAASAWNSSRSLPDWCELAVTSC